MTHEESLVLDLAALSERPYDFVIWAFPWGEPGTELEFREGPVGWQAQVLRDLQDAFARGREAGGRAAASALEEAYQCAIRSGRDVGKTALLAWLVWWALATREDTRGRCTANTEKQLRTVLWPEIAKWHRLFIASSLFKVTATSVYSADPARERNWRADALPWSEENPEAFSGFHNWGKRLFVLTDEASGIPDKIWEVIDGTMHEANTELLWFAPGNPTKNYGRFHDCFHRFASEWHTYKVDSRHVPFANADKIDRAIAMWGEDSDYVKVNYLGEFPEAGNIQLIPIEAIQMARLRVPQATHYEPLIMGVDLSRFGPAKSVAQFRRGRDARTLPTETWAGYSGPESAARISGLINKYSPDAVFIDEGGLGGPIIDQVRLFGHAVTAVNFGGKIATRPGGTLVANKRAEMFVSLRDWLREGGCVEDSQDLQDQLVSIEYGFNKKDEILLVSKEMMDESPDWADALALTFAFPVAPRIWRARTTKVDYDPFGESSPFANDREAA